ncbi:MAG: glutathione S-transferase [Pararhodobacter sp.]|nr:glutathione S-transferase [Pararhodobacter sp.]
MTYHLLVGDYAYSSWSLRGWLLCEAFGLKVETSLALLHTDSFADSLKPFFPARTVPALRLPEGVVIADSLAFAEELASRHPQAGHWPSEPAARAVARALAGEMHSSFAALRSHCPMNLRLSYSDCAPPQAVLNDLARIELLWDWARRATGSQGPWLCGAYCAADAFFAPVAARIAGYNLPVSPASMAYVAAHLAHEPFQRWRQRALVEGPEKEFYRRDWPQRPWPEPAPGR